MPVIINQVWEKLGLPLRLVAMTYRAVTIENALRRCHDFGVRVKRHQSCVNYHSALFTELGVVGFFVSNNLTPRTPVEEPTVGSEARKQHQVNQRENQRAQNEPEPPHRGRMRPFPEIAIPDQVFVLYVRLGKLDAEDKPRQKSEADQRQYDYPSCPETCR